MTPPRIPAVDHSTLTLGRRLGQGGQGTVHQVANKKINEAVGGGGWDVVYKEYGAAVLPDLDATALASRVDLVGTLSAAEGKWLCEKTAWPAAVVERHGHTCGFLMRAVPDRFQFAFRSLTGTSTGTKRLANLEYLLNDDSYVAGIGLTISDRDRLLLLADFAATLTRLHRLGITVGDLSPKNLLFTTAPQPECFLIDCDAMRWNGTTVLPQAETPDWQVPAGEEKATRASDLYKLALLAIRLMARDQTATDPAALAALGPELGDLARTSLTCDPARRPTPALWAEQLTAAATTASTTPAKAAAPRPGPGRPRASSAGRPGTGRPPGNASPAAGTGPGTTSPAKVAAGVAAVIAAVILAIALPHGGDSSNADASSTPEPSYSTSSTLPDDGSTSADPTYEPTDPYTSATDDEQSNPTPYVPDPTTEPPTPDPPSAPASAPPPPPPPRPDYYGAIAVGRDGSMGKSWDYRSWSAAEQGAMSRCPRSDCKVLVSFVNSCGAIAYNPNTNQYWGGRGATEAEAESNAISHAGGGSWKTVVCTTRYSS